MQTVDTKNSMNQLETNLTESGKFQTTRNTQNTIVTLPDDEFHSASKTSRNQPFHLSQQSRPQILVSKNMHVKGVASTEDSIIGTREDFTNANVAYFIPREKKSY